MPRQLDLVAPPGLRVQPEAGRTEPRLWVRRLVLWSEPGVMLREIVLRPGLNIIWSPDPAEQANATGSQNALGHGGGKSLFCRLLRYCLGEDRFAPDDQRNRVVVAFPEGLVGAEVIVDGTCWAILRPLGVGRKHFAIRERDLDDIEIDAVTSNGIASFLEAVESDILSSDVVSLVPGDRPLHAWLVALAWLARDQDCRFDRVLDWRSPASDSGSPVRTLSATRILDALRALIGAIDPEEHNLRAEIGELETEYQKAGQVAGHREWEANRMISRLARELGLREDELPPDRLAVEPLRQAAKAELARGATENAASDVADLDSLRATDEEARRRVDALAKRLTEVQSRIPEIERLVSRIKGELPAISFSIHRSENPICPICEVPIDRAIAEGCKLSDKLPDPEQILARWETHEQDLKRESQRLQENMEQQSLIGSELNSARKNSDDSRKQLRTAEQARDARAEAWYKGRRRIDDADRLDELLIAREQAQLGADELSKQIEAKRGQVGAYRETQAEVFRRLSQTFDAVIRELVGPTAQGRVALDGNGLLLTVEMGGDRSTTAIESLKVIAFDLAVMCMSIEGNTHMPAFLVHDSPREADLGLSVYHQIFRFARNLEQNQPLFQYVITTTTRPPDELIQMPWLRETLRGAPAEERLLRRDL